MFPGSFEYERAESVQDAIALREEHDGAEVELLAGGHSLLPTMKAGFASPDVVIDLGGIDALRGVESTDGNVRIGALTTYSEVAGDDDLRESVPAVVQAAEAIGDIQVRNRGTVGGNLAHSDPASDLPAAALAADATVHAEGPNGQRSIAADDFFTGLYETALEEDELLTAIEVPAHDIGVYMKKPSPSSGYAMVGVAAVLGLDGGTVESARVATTGAVDHATRLTGVEEALTSTVLDAEVAETAAARATDRVDEVQFMDDHQASAEYRRNLLGNYTRRALTVAADGVRG